jgi:iron(III) transport system permease protein
MARSILNSLIVMLGASGLALVIGFIIALGLSRARILGRRTLMFLLGGFLFVPLYVQAGGWNAGFGIQGWWTLSQVAGAQEPLRGIQAVVWIHAMACVPSVALILMCGFSRTIAAREELAMLEGGIGNLLRRVWIQSNLGWIAAALAWSIATVGNDMLVSNLYRVRTAVEQFYLDITVGQFSMAQAVVASVPAVLLAVVFGVVASQPLEFRSLERGNASTKRWFTEGWQTVVWTLVCWTLTGVAMFLPIVSLIIKAGWDATRVDGRIERKWLISRLAESVFRSPIDYREEMLWSLQVALYSSVASVLIALLVVPRLPKSGWLRGALFGVFALMVAIPGPAVNLMVAWFFLAVPIPIFSEIYDRTLVPTVIGVGFRVVPVTIFLLTIGWHRWFNTHCDLLAMDGPKSNLGTMIRFIKSSWRTLLLVWLWGTALSFADFSSYSQLLPPSVTTISKRIFELLHYGVRYQEAGLCLFLALCGMILGGISMTLLFRTDTEPISNSRLRQEATNENGQR